MSESKFVVRELPEQPSLENLKKQARALLKRARAGEAAAQARALVHFPALQQRAAFQAERFNLSGAQLVVAREYGFASWRKLRTQVEALSAATMPTVPNGALLPVIALGEAVLAPYSEMHSSRSDAPFQCAVRAALESEHGFALCLMHSELSEPYAAVTRVDLRPGVNGVPLVRLRYRSRVEITRFHAEGELSLAQVTPFSQRRLSAPERDAAVNRLFLALAGAARRVEWLPRADLSRFKDREDLQSLIAAAATQCTDTEKRALLAARDDSAMVDLLCPVLERQEQSLGKQGAPPDIATAPACLVVLGAESHPHLLGRCYALTLPSTSLGRGPDADVQLMSDAVSRRHARIELNDAAFVLADQGSTNGTFIARNSEPVTRHVLADGDRFTVGDTILCFLRAPDLAAKTAQSITDAAEYDALTQVKNQHTWRVGTERCVLRARSSGAPLTLLVFQIEALALVRERKGALVAHALLANVAAALHCALPAHAVIGRCGDRLAVTLTDTDIPQATQLAERLCTSVATQGMPATLSYGLSALSRTTGAEELWADALATLPSMHAIAAA